MGAFTYPYCGLNPADEVEIIVTDVLREMLTYSCPRKSEPPSSVSGSRLDLGSRAPLPYRHASGRQTNQVLKNKHIL